MTAADTDLYVQRVGDRSSPTIVFIHGTGSWSESWRPSMEQVTALGFQAISIDLPPFGYSVPPNSGDYTKPAQARRILAALDALGVGEVVFVGHSFGAGPQMEAVLRAPQRVRAVVLVDAALGLERAPAEGFTPLQSLLRLRWLSEPLAAAYLTNPVFTKFLLQRFITEKERATEAWVGLFRRPLYLQGTYQGVASWLPELFAGRGIGCQRVLPSRAEQVRLLPLISRATADTRVVSDLNALGSGDRLVESHPDCNQLQRARHEQPSPYQLLTAGPKTIFGR